MSTEHIPVPSPVSHTKIASAQELFAETLRDLRSAPPKSLVAVGLPVFLYSLITMPFGSEVPQPLYMFLPAPLGLIAVIVAYYVFILASITSIQQAGSRWTPPIKESFLLAKTKFWPLVWLTAISILITLGSEIPLIIPVLFVSMWTMFAYPALILDDLRGVHAISYGRELQRGVWGKVMWRFFAPGMLIVSLSIILGILGAFGTDTQGFYLVYSLLSPIFLVFFSTYLTKLYRSLVMFKGIVPDAAKTKNRKLIIGLALWGAAVVAIGAFLVLWSATETIKMTLPDDAFFEMPESVTV